MNNRLIQGDVLDVLTVERLGEVAANRCACSPRANRCAWNFALFFPFALH